MIDKDNPPKDKDNISDVKMTSPSNPKTVQFVSPLETDQLPHSTIHSENDDMLTKTVIMEDISHMMSNYDDSPNNKDNSPNNKKSSISYAKIQQIVKHLTDNSPSNIHINNTNNSINTDTSTPSPFTSHKTKTPPALLLSCLTVPKDWNFLTDGHLITILLTTMTPPPHPHYPPFHQHPHHQQSHDAMF